MPIRVLSDDTINKIAAGEVVERPLNIVKELLENAIDAGAKKLTVEVREGGNALIRVADDGAGIPFDEVRAAFRRHATSKILDADDLLRVTTLGFRGEALASIAAVSNVEVITKTKDALMAARYQIDGGVEQGLSEVGAPDGTTMLVRELFKHVPARRKFLKSPQTEAARIQEIVEMEALAHPEIAFRYVQDGRQKLSTLGNGKLKDVIYAIYGREIASNLLAVDRRFSTMADGAPSELHVHGYLGLPVITRSNRNFELSFVNGRYVKNQLLAKALEDGYRPFLMQHKFPFAVLLLEVAPSTVDVNVHPQKMEVRFSDGQFVYNSILDSVNEALGAKELVVEARLDKETKRVSQADAALPPAPKEQLSDEKSAYRAETVGANPLGESGFAAKPAIQHALGALPKEHVLPNVLPKRVEEQACIDHIAIDTRSKKETALEVSGALPPATKEQLSDVGQTYHAQGQTSARRAETAQGHGGFDLARFADLTQGKAEQQSLFAPAFLSEQARNKHRIIGQLFETYWLIEYGDKLYIIDQHAAHEKVMFERLMKRFQAKQPVSQYLNPPILLTLSAKEAVALEQFSATFAQLGYEISHLGERDYSVTAVPADLPSIAKKELLLEMLDDLSAETGLKTAESVYDKLASMSCKAAVKGNNRLSMMEADRLIAELLQLENPYACPHGRPTIISMSHYELDKKFRRIV